MTLVKQIETLENPPEDVIFPDRDLYSDEPPVSTHLHLQQMLLLLKCLDWLRRDKPKGHSYAYRIISPGAISPFTTPLVSAKRKNSQGQISLWF